MCCRIPSDNRSGSHGSFQVVSGDISSNDPGTMKTWLACTARFWKFGVVQSWKLGLFGIYWNYTGKLQCIQTIFQWQYSDQSFVAQLKRWWVLTTANLISTGEFSGCNDYPACSPRQNIAVRFMHIYDWRRGQSCYDQGVTRTHTNQANLVKRSVSLL